MIGTYEDAARAVEGDLPDLHPGTPYGWRRVHLINGVIYKVDKVIGGNNDEWWNYVRLRDTRLPEHIRIPKMHLYEVGKKFVIAAEYIDGDALTEYEISEELESQILDLGIGDICEGNILISEGIYYLVDLEL